VTFQRLYTNKTGLYLWMREEYDPTHMPSKQQQHLYKQISSAQLSPVRLRIAGIDSRGKPVDDEEYPL
jgi:hypothetical protein